MSSPKPFVAQWGILGCGCESYVLVRLFSPCGRYQSTGGGGFQPSWRWHVRCLPVHVLKPSYTCLYLPAVLGLIVQDPCLHTSLSGEIVLIPTFQGYPPNSPWMLSAPHPLETSQISPTPSLLSDPVPSKKPSSLSRSIARKVG
jgi:hypothetical protein